VNLRLAVQPPAALMDLGEVAFMTRRAFALAALTGLFSRIVGRNWTTVSEAGAGRPAFRTLGACYLATEGVATRSQRFVDRVVDLSRRSGTMPGQILAQRRAADFQSSNTVILDGWVVAESEALFCAGLTLRATTHG
jgi:hypothetical protein